MTGLPRTLHPALNPAGYLAAAGAIYAAAVMITNAVHHHGVISVPVVLAAVTAVGAILTRTAVTPVADPKDGNGNPLVTAPATVPQPAAYPAGAVLGSLNVSRAEAGPAPLPQPSGDSRVIIENAPEPPASAGPAGVPT